MQAVSGWRTAAGVAADAVIAADDGSISDPAPTCTASADVGPGSLTVRNGLISTRCEAGRPVEAITLDEELGRARAC